MNRKKTEEKRYSLRETGWIIKNLFELLFDLVEQGKCVHQLSGKQIVVSNNGVFSITEDNSLKTKIKRSLRYRILKSNGEQHDAGCRKYGISEVAFRRLLGEIALPVKGTVDMITEIFQRALDAKESAYLTDLQIFEIEMKRSFTPEVPGFNEELQVYTDSSVEKEKEITLLSKIRNRIQSRQKEKVCDR